MHHPFYLRAFIIEGTVHSSSMTHAILCYLFVQWDQSLKQPTVKLQCGNQPYCSENHSIHNLCAGVLHSLYLHGNLDQQFNIPLKLLQ